MKISDLHPYLYGLKSEGETFPGLPIVNREGRKIFFRPTPPQEYALEKMKEQDDKPLRVVVLKNRQVGFSTLFLVLMVAYAHRFAHRECYAVAQLQKTANILRERGARMWETLYHKTIKKGTTKQIQFPHENDSYSFLITDTAGSLKGGRGPTAHSLMMTEASRYPPDSISTFTSAVGYNPESMILIETTANGKSGDGYDYYHLWQAAEEGKNEYLPIFIPWTMDNECRRAIPDDFELISEVEEELHHEHHLEFDQIYFRRMKIDGDFAGNESKFCQEFPLTPSEAFVSSGVRIFYMDEIKAVEKTLTPPKTEGIFEIDSLKFRKKRGGYLRIWEAPVEGHKYYIGADAAKCDDEESDFAAAVLWNGTMKTQAATIEERLDPKEFAFVLNLLGRWYNNAMLSVEITGGWGNHVQMELKDSLNYPNLYLWKGKNDQVGTKKAHNYGWMTTFSSRNDLMSVFKESLRNGLIIKDESLFLQMDGAEQEMGLRWSVSKGHDDILMAAMIGWMACYQYPPPRYAGADRSKVLDDGPGDDGGYVSPDAAYLIKHVSKLNKLVQRDINRRASMGGMALAKTKYI